MTLAKQAMNPQVAVLLLFALGAVARGTQVWDEQEEVPDTTYRHSFRIDLVQRNLKSLDLILKHVSDPSSPGYGQYLTNQQLTELVGQPKEVHDWIIRWLNSKAECARPCGVNAFPIAHGDHIRVKACNAWIECFFGRGPLKFFREQESEAIRAALTERASPLDLDFFDVPQELRSFISRIWGVANLPTIPRKMVSSGKNPGENVDPLIIRSLYECDQYSIGKNLSSPQASQAAAQFQEDYWYPSDILAFQAHYSLPSNNVSIIIGADLPDSKYAALGEASLDFEYITTVEDMVTWGWSQYALDFTEWAISVMSTKNAPLVHSISYGGGESIFSTDDMQSDNTEFQKMGTLGFTILVASGDQGPGSVGKCKSFDPTFPASSPYVTAVGGTYLNSDGESQTAWSGSGGGFSGLFPAPSYQNTVAQDYLQAESGNLPNSKYYNSAGRAFPDVAALATNYAVCIEGWFGGTPLTGTSAATPVFAAMLTFVNAKRSENGKPPLGFFNPLLYENQVVGTDITSGKSVSSKCNNAGWAAAPGWDPVTGFGTPLMSTLLKYYL